MFFSKGGRFSYVVNSVFVGYFFSFLFDCILHISEKSKSLIHILLLMIKKRDPFLGKDEHQFSVIVVTKK
jgi:hypothetical protein